MIEHDKDMWLDNHDNVVQYSCMIMVFSWWWWHAFWWFCFFILHHRNISNSIRKTLHLGEMWDMINDSSRCSKLHSCTQRIYISNPIEVMGKTRENLIFPPPSGMRLPRITSWKSAVWPENMTRNAWGLGSVATNLACTFLTDLEHVWDSTEWYSAWNKYSKCKLMVGRLVSPVPLLGFFSFGFKDGKREVRIVWSWFLGG